ncbi:MAG: ZIP family metal transporter [Pirellulales bacterium]
MQTGLLAVYSVLIVGASLLGGFVPSVMRLGHRRMQMLLSVVGGLMLGVGLLHQLPHSLIIAKQGDRDIDWCMGWLVGGLLLTFFLIRWFHAHSHDEAEPEGDAASPGDSGACPPAADHEHQHAHAHGQEHCSGAGHGAGQTTDAQPHHAHHHHHHHSGHDHGSGSEFQRSTSWIGIFFGLSIHTLLDGVALGAHVAADAAHSHGPSSSFWLLGVGTFLGVVLHKPLDSLSITTLMAARGWSKRSQMLVNLGYSLMCPLGILLFSFGASQMGAHYHQFVSAAVAMAAGVFICISLSDLLPEIEFHSHDRLLLSGLLVLGLAMAWGVGLLEPEDAHHGGSHEHGSHEHGDHDHGDHDHAAPSQGDPKHGEHGPTGGQNPGGQHPGGQPADHDHSSQPAGVSRRPAEDLSSGEGRAAAERLASRGGGVGTEMTVERTGAGELFEKTTSDTGAGPRYNSGTCRRVHREFEGRVVAHRIPGGRAAWPTAQSVQPEHRNRWAPPYWLTWPGKPRSIGSWDELADRSS